MKHRILIALLVIIFAFTTCSPDGNIPGTITDPLEEAPQPTSPEERDNAKLAAEELKKLYIAFNDDINSGNERDEIYNAFKDPKLSGTTLKTEDGSFSCTMITELEISEGSGETTPVIKEANIAYDEVVLEGQTYWAKIKMTDNCKNTVLDFVTENSQEEVFRISGKIEYSENTSWAITITSIKLNDGPELINDESLTENDIKFSF